MTPNFPRPVFDANASAGGLGRVGLERLRLGQIVLWGIGAAAVLVPLARGAHDGPAGSCPGGHLGELAATRGR